MGCNKVVISNACSMKDITVELKANMPEDAHKVCLVVPKPVTFTAIYTEGIVKRSDNGKDTGERSAGWIIKGPCEELMYIADSDFNKYYTIVQES